MLKNPMIRKLFEWLQDWWLGTQAVEEEVDVSELKNRLDKFYVGQAYTSRQPVNPLFALLRKQLAGISPDWEAIEKMSAEEREAFLTSVHKIYHEPAFKILIKELKFSQLAFSMLQAEDWEKTIFGRATVNGIALVDEEFEGYEAAYQDMVSKKPDFDKDAIV